MNKQDSAFAYHQSTAFGATAVGQVVALYDTILRDFHRAIGAVDAGEVEKRVNAITHALMVVGELQGVLDFDRGAEVARRLDSFYKVTRGMMVEASVTASREKFQELVSMFTRIRSAWSQVERTIAPSEASQRLRISSEPQPSFSQNNSEPPQSSGGSGWSA
jgi:flagellar secretion chaperone FliS